MKKSICITFIFCFVSFVAFAQEWSPAGNAQNLLKTSDFKTPPSSTHVHTWWHWISGNVSKDGITKDLESMKRQGVVQATILNVGGSVSARLDVKNIKFNSPEWYEMFQFSLKEADRLGIKIGVHNCDGWETSGGPWITAEHSMKTTAWTKTYFDGGKQINTQLEQPQATDNFYRDFAVIAYPAVEKQNSFQKAKFVVTVNKSDTKSILRDGNPKSGKAIKKGDVINFSFANDYTTNKLALFPYIPFSWGGMEKKKSQFRFSSSVDGIAYSNISDLEFVGLNKTVEAHFPITTARYYRLECLNCDHDYYAGELELLTNMEEAAYKPEIPFLLEKSSNVSALQESNFDQSKQTGGLGINENSIIDISRFVSVDGRLQWKAPRGKWCVIRFGYTTTAKQNNPATPEGRGYDCDKMDATAIQTHFANFPTSLIKASGNYCGNTFKFLLIDSWEAFFQNWTKAFPAEFEKRRNYSLIKWLPVLTGEVVGNVQQSEAFLHDYRKTIADLIDQNYYKQFAQLCHKNKLEMHAEVIYGGGGSYPPLDVLSSNKYCDMPMTEFWALFWGVPNKNQLYEYIPSATTTPYFPAYAALACNKQIIGSEAYTGYANYCESPAMLKPFGDKAFCSGINQLVFHSYVHQPFDNKPGVTLGRFGAHFNRNNPWWEYVKDWLDYQGRVQYFLQKGEPVVDVIFYVGDRYPQNLENSILNSLNSGYRANPCNFEMLMQKAKVVDGKLSFGGKQTFPLLALPLRTEMDFATLERIAQLVKEGLKIYGPKPKEMLSLLDIKSNSLKFNKLTDILWGTNQQNSYGKGMVFSGTDINQVLNCLAIKPDFSSNVGDPKELMYIHKLVGNDDIYFVFNQQNKALDRELSFRVEGKTPSIWNPEFGTVSTPAIFTIEQNQLRIPLIFKAYESFIFMFSNSKVENTFTTSPAKLEVAKATEITNYNARLEFFPIYEQIIPSVEITQLKSLTEFDDLAIKYFAGKVKYTISFDVPEGFTSKDKKMSLNLGEMDATAEVRLNGKLLNFAWMPFSEIPISGLLKTTNKLEITLATVCRNRFIGDLIQFGSCKTMFTTAPIANILNKEMPLKRSGIMGPLKLMVWN